MRQPWPSSARQLQGILICKLSGKSSTTLLLAVTTPQGEGVLWSALGAPTSAAKISE